jgi:high-affinity iron transporter
MLAPLIIMLREGLEAALVVAIIAAYLKQTGRAALLPAVWAGVALAALLCLAVGVGLTWLSADLPMQAQELFEAAVAVLAAAVLTWMLFWMRRVGRSIKRELQAGVDHAAGSGGWSMALVGMAFLAVAREGLESVLFLFAAFQQGVGPQAPLGAVLGLVLAVALGAGLYSGGVHLDLGRFFRWTGLFLIFVAAGLLAGGLHSLYEAGVWTWLLTPAYDTSHVLRQSSPLGAILRGLFGYSDSPSVGELLVYWAYLLPTLLLFAFGERLPRRGRIRATAGA